MLLCALMSAYHSEEMTLEFLPLAVYRLMQHGVYDMVVVW